MGEMGGAQNHWRSMLVQRPHRLHCHWPTGSQQHPRTGHAGPPDRGEAQTPAKVALGTPGGHSSLRPKSSTGRKAVLTVEGGISAQRQFGISAHWRLRASHATNLRAIQTCVHVLRGGAARRRDRGLMCWHATCASTATSFEHIIM